MENIAGLVGQQRGPQLLETFAIPPSLQVTGLATKVSFKLLSSEEEITASRLGQYNVVKAQTEAAKMAIAKLDGKSVDAASGDIDEFWEKGGPKVRSLLLQAYAKISSPTGDEETSFFGSQESSVG